MRLAAVHRYASACAAAFPEIPPKGLVLPLSELGFFVPSEIRAHGRVLAGFHRPARGNGGTRNNPPHCRELQPARATTRARSKHACAFATSGSGDFSAISPAMRSTSASHHLSSV